MDVREKLVELILNSDADKKLVLYDLYDLTHERTGCAKYFADYLISHGVTVQEWISVKDRLPGKDGRYIVTACDEESSCGDGIWYDTVVIEAEHYKGEWSWNNNGTEYDITDFVTHWQPIPQPPKGE